MEVVAAIETRRPIRETPLQRLGRELRKFAQALLRVTLLSGLLIPILLVAFLTVDIPYRGFDHLFSMGPVKPGNWLSLGYFLMAAVAPLVVLIARRFGGEEASRVVTRGGGKWWRAPFFALLGAYLVQTSLYFPIAYWKSVAPWMNWMVEDVALKSLLIVGFLGIYRVLMNNLKPRGGYGG